MNQTSVLSKDEYDKIVERVTADLFHSNETFRKTVVHRELGAIVLKWAAIVGAANVIALVGIYLGVSAFMQQTIAERATKAVTDKNKAIDDSITELTKTAIAQTAKMQSQLDDAARKLSDGNKQVAETVKQAAALSQESARLSALRRIYRKLSKRLLTIRPSLMTHTTSNG